MGELVWAGLMPHPPLMIPEVGRGQESRIKDTLAAARKLAADLQAAAPEVIVLITPHGAVFSDAIAINVKPVLAGDMGQFGAPGVKISKKNDLRLAAKITRAALQHQIAVAELDDDLSREYGVSTRLDHGAVVPLYFLEEAGLEYALVHIAMGILPREELYLFGKVLQEAIGEVATRAAVLASGDLSHRLTPEAPAGYHVKGREFDAELQRLLATADVKGLMEMPPQLVEQAGECGFRPILMMLGALDGYDVKPEILSYEGPFGVGYMIASFQPLELNEQRQYVDRLFKAREDQTQQNRQQESAAVKLARQALETYVTTGKMPAVPAKDSSLWSTRAGAFVSLKKLGQLRGCIGTTEPTKQSLAAEIMHNAIAAGTRDPRFDPVTAAELPHLTYSVDVLSEPEEIPSASFLDPRKYGVIVRQGRRSGLLLPDLEGVDTVEEQVEIAKRKAGITGDDYNLARFTVTRYR